ncbi:MAG: hypothetical protein ACYCZ1_03940 [Candidatus Humimicrobiaceae bacterium]
MPKFLVKLNRLFAYILIPLVIAILITGYRNTEHFTFINRGVANLLHSVWLNLAFLVLFTVHSLLGIKLALIRNKVTAKYLNALLVVIGILFIAGFTYFSFRAG